MRDLTIPAVLELDLPATTKLVLVAMADYAWDLPRECTASVASIAGRVGIDPRNARRHIHALEAAGWVTLKARGRGHATSTYVIETDRLLAVLAAATAGRKAQRTAQAHQIHGVAAVEITDASVPSDRMPAPPQTGYPRPFRTVASASQTVHTLHTVHTGRAGTGAVIPFPAATNRNGEGGRRWQKVAGVKCWTPRDLAAVKALIAVYGLAAVEATAARLRDEMIAAHVAAGEPYHPDDVAPLPSAVSAALATAKHTNSRPLPPGDPNVHARAQRRPAESVADRFRRIAAEADDRECVDADGTFLCRDA
jgi:hypothetical protein